MMNKIILFFCFLFIANITFAQEEDYEYDEDVESFKGLKDEKKKFDFSRVKVGGDFGLGFQANSFFVEFSPTIGYQIIRNRLEIGPGLVYQHESSSNNYAVNNIGGQAYIRGYIWNGIFLQVDGFLVNYNYKDILLNRTSSFSYGNGFAGGGYAFNEDGTVSFIISIKTNLVTDRYYPTRRIIPKVGFQIRL